VNVLDERLSEDVFLADSANRKMPRNYCRKEAEEMERKRKCSSAHVCRDLPTTGREWRRRLSRHKYVLDMPGFGPWSHRLRFLLLSGAVVFQQKRAFDFEQFYDRPLKEYGVIVPFTDANDLLSKVRWLQKHDEVAKRIASAAHAFAWSCLSQEGIRMFIVSLMKKLQSIGSMKAGPATGASHRRVALDPSNPRDFARRKEICQWGDGNDVLTLSLSAS